MKLDALIKHFADSLREHGVDVTPVSETPWLDSFISKLPAPLPRSYEAFLRAYRFPSFDLSDIEFYSNQGDSSEQALVIASLSDPVLSRVCLSNLLVAVGRPVDGAYDPVCFDLRARGREAPLVRVDHEKALIEDRAVVICEVLPSFLHLAKATLAA